MRKLMAGSICLFGLALFVASDASAAPAADTSPPARAAPTPTPTPVPERRAVAPQPIRPISTEKNYKLESANRLIGWGIGTGVFGGLVTLTGVALVVYGHAGSGDDVHYKTGYGVLGLGLFITLATSPLWIVGMIKKAKAERIEGTRDNGPGARRFVDTAYHRDQRRLLRRSGPPALTVLGYAVRF